MKRTCLAVAFGTVALLGGLTVSAQSTGTSVTVYKDPSCGCCAKWVDHLKQNGFATKVIKSRQLDDIKTEKHVPRQARSCHTALVNGYAIEGHVPASDVQRLLKERPSGIVGLAVPGMPIGSPGMEMPGRKAQPFDVLAFDKDGHTRVFVSHGK
ncbi:MAG: hypothetical protein ABS36_12520 [Acidobacteria bacterium SCN 69-37]|nr:MAG: hypothetical protein ABS36_12520 [Acidobacteria bacterium SCN 69-37]